MTVPARAFFWCHIGLDEVRNDFPVRCFGDAKITVKEKITQAIGFELCIARFDVREQRGSFIKHGDSLGAVHQKMVRCNKQELFQAVWDNLCHERQHLRQSFRSHQLR